MIHVTDKEVQKRIKKLGYKGCKNCVNQIAPSRMCERAERGGDGQIHFICPRWKKKGKEGERMSFAKEWEIEATIEIRTSVFCDTKGEAEKEAHKYLSELCQGLYPDCCSNSYEIENIYSQEEESE